MVQHAVDDVHVHGVRLPAGVDHPAVQRGDVAVIVVHVCELSTGKDRQVGYGLEAGGHARRVSHRAVGDLDTPDGVRLGREDVHAPGRVRVVVRGGPEDAVVGVLRPHHGLRAGGGVVGVREAALVIAGGCRHLRGRLLGEYVLDARVGDPQVPGQHEGVRVAGGGPVELVRVDQDGAVGAVPDYEGDVVAGLAVHLGPGPPLASDALVYAYLLVVVIVEPGLAVGAQGDEARPVLGDVDEVHPVLVAIVDERLRGGVDLVFIILSWRGFRKLDHEQRSRPR